MSGAARPGRGPAGRAPATAHRYRGYRCAHGAHSRAVHPRADRPRDRHPGRGPRATGTLHSPARRYSRFDSLARRGPATRRPGAPFHALPTHSRPLHSMLTSPSRRVSLAPPTSAILIASTRFVNAVRQLGSSSHLDPRARSSVRLQRSESRTAPLRALTGRGCSSARARAPRTSPRMLTPSS